VIATRPASIRPTAGPTAGPPFPFWKPRPAAAVLFCFPYAGSGGMSFRRWARGLPPTLNVCPVEYPGRGARWRETPCARVDELAAEIGEAIARMAPRRFAFYGHSLGGLVAFETVRHLRRHGGPSPTHLVVSGTGAPHMPNPNPLIHQRADADLLAALLRYNGVPPLVAQSPELLNHLLPVVRADLAAFETYRYVEEPPLDCPLVAYGGLDDAWVRRDRLEGWERHTSASFRLRMFPGEHFFLNREDQAVPRALVADLGAA
jgi:medium-chain acyl-[acyl-carrier-protein] hydrolase